MIDDVPAAAMAAMRNGVQPYRMFRLDLGGTTHRFTSAPRAIPYDGATWDSGTPLRSVGNVGSADQNGTLELLLDDAAQTWATRFNLLGESGKPVEVHYVVPYGSGLFFPKSVFVGRTQRVDPVRPRGDEGYRLSVECADAAAVPQSVEAQWTSDAFQRELAKRLNLIDDSHVISNKAATLIWHST